jgi:hypothetical protein
VLQQKAQKAERAKREERAERRESKWEEEREIFGRNERREKKIGRNSSCRVGSKLKEIGFLIFTKCTVACQKWKASVHFVKKFEDEEQFWMTAGAGFFVLFFINGDEEQFWITVGDGLK